MSSILLGLGDAHFPLCGIGDILKPFPNSYQFYNEYLKLVETTIHSSQDANTCDFQTNEVSSCQHHHTLLCQASCWDLWLCHICNLHQYDWTCAATWFMRDHVWEYRLCHTGEHCQIFRAQHGEETQEGLSVRLCRGCFVSRALHAPAKWIASRT